MKTLLYDGDCSLCLAAIARLKQLGLLENVQACPWNDFPQQDPVLAERIRSEFLLVEPNHIDGGFDAITRLIEDRYLWTSRLFKLPGVRPLGQSLYKTVSLNRRILAPTGHLVCACDPPFHRGYRVALWGMLLGIALLSGSLALMLLGQTFCEALWLLTVATSCGWILNFLVFIVLFHKRYWEFAQQYLVVMAIGGLWLLFVAIISWLGSIVRLPVEVLVLWLVLGIVGNRIIMLLSLRRRSAMLGFPKWAPWLWMLLQELAGTPVFIFFDLLFTLTKLFN